MILGRDRDETIRLTADAYGISEVDAAEIVDIEDGRSDGDVARPPVPVRKPKRGPRR
jgi:hypothetical protein